MSFGDLVELLLDDANDGEVFATMGLLSNGCTAVLEYARPYALDLDSLAASRRRYEHLATIKADTEAAPTHNPKTGKFVWSRGDNRFGWQCYLGGFYGTGCRVAHFLPALKWDLSMLPAV
ncbi:hypothetical protein [Hoeflea poritis]|uniref:Uncharacterized protein n=1 Tax=Hoeflea poritis TaxID=2993659 RepID=A0ABT4VUZ3_9HYPH|nr:hypothetical protein [Hoeflea poritis]MDA4848515.1 hypothetical protein [Hoeflea poritis]